ncbi:hypothetical protein K438DRAFT_1996065 [Mycena galopus ATCC 62051]|nr:hypothetical protein K438DRAFT_1996065 [Mycena galopus ATCC 62051]
MPSAAVLELCTFGLSLIHFEFYLDPTCPLLTFTLTTTTGGPFPTSLLPTRLSPTRHPQHSTAFSSPLLRLCHRPFFPHLARHPTLHFYAASPPRLRGRSLARAFAAPPARRLDAALYAHVWCMYCDLRALASPFFSRALLRICFRHTPRRRRGARSMRCAWRWRTQRANRPRIHTERDGSDSSTSAYRRESRPGVERKREQLLEVQ